MDSVFVREEKSMANLEVLVIRVISFNSSDRVLWNWNSIYLILGDVSGL